VPAGYRLACDERIHPDFLEDRMAIGAVSRGDLVVVNSSKLALRGLFVVDSVNGNDVWVFTPDDANLASGGNRDNALHLDKSTDILAVHKAASISA
jgi:hypothetical protein